MATADFAAGGYRYIPAVFQYSGGVAAMPGHAIRRLHFRDPVPLAEGFRRAERLMAEAGRPPDRVLRLRAALARALQRGRLSRLQPGLRRDA